MPFPFHDSTTIIIGDNDGRGSDVQAGLSSPSLTKPGPKKPKPSLAQALHRPLLGLGFCL